MNFSSVFADFIVTLGGVFIALLSERWLARRRDKRNTQNLEERLLNHLSETLHSKRALYKVSANESGKFEERYLYEISAGIVDNLLENQRRCDLSIIKLGDTIDQISIQLAENKIVYRILREMNAQCNIYLEKSEVYPEKYVDSLRILSLQLDESQSEFEKINPKFIKLEAGARL